VKSLGIKVEGYAMGLGLVAFAVIVANLATIAIEFYEGARSKRRDGQMGWLAALGSLFAKHRRRYGGYVVHVGILCVGLALVGNVVKVDADPTMRVGQSAKVGDYEVRFDDLLVKDEVDRVAYTARMTLIRDGKEVGVLLAPGYMMFLDYDDVGYVKDEDKDKLDADKLLKAMSEGQDEANEERKSRGWDQLKLKGWATAPHYDEKTNNLKWAINLTTSHDNYAKVFINESIRLLGRAGVMNVTLAIGTEGFKAAEADAEKLLAGNFSYVSGQKYSEFKAGDKVAAYGLSALVLGGGAVLAAKMGWLAALGAWFSKMWKAFVFVIVALGAALKQLWNKITGSRPTNPPDGTPPAA